MLKREYHCFVAGLADLVFDGTRNYVNMPEFREELRSVLHPADYRLVSTLFLPHDNKNLLAFLEEKQGIWDDLGSYSQEDFEEQKRIIHAILREDNILPEYMVDLMIAWYDPEVIITRAEVERKLTEGYLETALNSGNKFLEKWINYERDAKNIFTLVNSKSLELEPGKIIIGNDSFAKELIEISERGKDFSIPSEPEYASEIFKIAVENEFLERERNIDIARWYFIDSATFFEYFTIDLILGYLLKLSIVLRWKQLEPETGRAMLQKLIEDIEKPILSTDFGTE